MEVLRIKVDFRQNTYISLGKDLQANIYAPQGTIRKQKFEKAVFFTCFIVVHNIFIRNAFNILIVYYIIRIYNLTKKKEINLKGSTNEV